ncbi:MAG: SPOR domain-containing protein [Paracoccaceae bacterium]
MRDDEYDDVEPDLGFDPEPAPRAGRSLLSAWTGTACAAALLAGLSLWLYGIGTRDTQAIPVIAAAEGPIKLRPEGAEDLAATPHQDVQSFEVARGPDAGAEPTRLAPPPARPTSEDQSLSLLEAALDLETEEPATAPANPVAPAPAAEGQTPAAEGQTPAPEAQDTSDAPPVALPPTVTIGEEDAAETRFADTPSRPRGEALTVEPQRLSFGPAPSLAPAPPAAPSRAADAGPRTPASAPVADRAALDETDLAALDPASADAPPAAPARRIPEPPVGEGSPLAPALVARVPSDRPTDLPRRMVLARQDAALENNSLAEAAARSALQIQLGAYRDPDITRRKWEEVQVRHAEILHNRALDIQETVSGNVTWYRLRVGPVRTRREAAALCQALVARGQDCIVATNR